MTETPTGGAVATTSKPATATGSSTGSTTGSTYKPYYPRTDVEFGLLWNDGQVTKVSSSSTTGGVKDAIRYFTNSIKLRRIGVFTKNFYVTGIVSREVEKKAATSSEWSEGKWNKYELTREDMLDLYKAG